MLRCDNYGCNETHPLDHDCLGEPSFGTGRWLGWIYVDMNRPDLFERELRFCGTSCLEGWLINLQYHRKNRTGFPRLDEALRRPHDETARKRAGLGVAPQVTPLQAHTNRSGAS